MPLEILLILVIGGIAGITALLHLLGLSARRKILSDAQARSDWLRHFPDDEVTETLIGPDGFAALVRTPQGYGLVWSFGADTTARRLNDAVVHKTAAGLRIEFRDFAAPSVALRLPPEFATRWYSAVKELSQ